VAGRRRRSGTADALSSVWRYLPALVRAALITIVLSCLAMALAVALGVAVRAAGCTEAAPARGAHGLRRADASTPVLLQLFVLYYGLAEVVRLPAFVPRCWPRPQLRRVRERDLPQRPRGRPEGPARAARVLGFSERQVFTLVRGPQACASPWRR